ncbi:MAG: histidinol-phosphate aminotransferase family protein [Chloroflexi bacterium]|nr:histidinol-phosphate aminotransferase family protein [Chloroflexota bacterium]
MSSEAHGGLNLAELRAAGLDPDSVLDFSVNVNPFGPSPLVSQALRDLDVASYPDREAIVLREALARANAVGVENLLVGNGTAELIWLAAHAFLRDGGPALIVGPTFGEYERAARAVGAEVTEVRAGPPDFCVDVDRLIAAIESTRPRLVFLCNPNNPTGARLTGGEVWRIAAACGESFLVLDEAYRSFVTLSPFGPPPRNNVIVMRSMTKDFALAGLRLGYALARPELVAALRAIQPPWSVNGPAQAAGLAALADLGHLRRTLQLTQEAARDLRMAMAAAGARVNESQTHFHLVEIGDGATWRAWLLRRGCLVRDCASFGLPQYVRVGTRRPGENEKLIQAWGFNLGRTDL